MSAPKAPASLYGFAVFQGLSIILMGTSLGTTYWTRYYLSDVFVSHTGLFKACNKNGVCVDYDSDAFKPFHVDFSKIKVIQALCLIAMVLYIMSFIIMAAFVFVQKMVTHSKNVGWAVLAISLIGGVFASAGVSRYIVIVLDDRLQLGAENSDRFGYSFYLAILSVGLSGGAGLFAIISVSRLYSIQQQQAVYPSTGQVVGAPVGYVYPPVQQQYPVGGQTAVYPQTFQYSVGGQAFTGAPRYQGFVGAQPPAYDQKPSTTY